MNDRESQLWKRCILVLYIIKKLEFFTLFSREKEWNLKCFHLFREWKVKWKCLEIEIENEKWNEKALKSRSRVKSEMKMPRDRDREVKFQNNSREFSRNETLAGYCTEPTLCKILSKFALCATDSSGSLFRWLSNQFEFQTHQGQLIYCASNFQIPDSFFCENNTDDNPRETVIEWWNSDLMFFYCILCISRRFWKWSTQGSYIWMLTRVIFAYHFFFFVFLGHNRTQWVIGSINLPD